MNIEAENFNVKCTHGELFDIAWKLNTSLMYEVQTHWIYHQEAFKRDREEIFKNVRILFVALGRPDLYNDALKKVDEMIDNHNNTQKKA